MPSSQPSTPFDALPGQLPTVPIPENSNLGKAQRVAQDALETGLDPTLVTKDVLWRDWLSITGQVQTRSGVQNVVDAWRRASVSRSPFDFQFQPAKITSPIPGSAWVNVRFTFSTRQSDGLTGLCAGTVCLVPDPASNGSWKVWMLATMLDQFKDYGHPDTPRPDAPRPQVDPSGQYHVSCLVVGAGQAGLSLAGRLSALQVDNILLEQKPSVGYGWYGKYDSVRQHTIREYNNLPFGRTWDSSDPELLPAAKVVDGFRRYVDRYNINIWLSSSIVSCSWEEHTQTWLVTVRVGGASGELRSIRARHLALTMGAGHTMPSRPPLPGLSKFKGQVLHSADYKHSKAWQGKRGVVVGSGTTAHDVAQDMFDAQLSNVTMIQRSKTAVYPITWLQKGQSQLYNLQIPTGMADSLGSIFPEKITREILTKTFKALTELEHDRFDALERAGFLLDRDTGMMDNILGRYGGYYIDVGTSPRIAAGDIKIKAGVPISEVTEQGLVFADGSSLPADVIVFATGYDHDYRNQVASIVGRDIADGLGEFWGLDANGDLRGLMKPVHPGLWLLGGAAPQARFYSRFIALQVQAEVRAWRGRTSKAVRL